MRLANAVHQANLQLNDLCYNSRISQGFHIRIKKIARYQNSQMLKSTVIMKGSPRQRFCPIQIPRGIILPMASEENLKRWARLIKKKDPPPPPPVSTPKLAPSIGVVY